MKKSHVLTLVGASTVLAAFESRAQCTNCASPFYIDAGLGLAIQQDAEIQNSPFGNSGDVQFDPGLRADIHLGYKLNHSFSVELETGVIWNTVNNFRTPGGDNKASTQGYNADLYELPLLANFVYRPLHGAFQPFIGIGGGGAATMFDAANIPLFANHFSVTDWTFAYQAEVGFSYAVSRSVKLGLAYELSLIHI